VTESSTESRTIVTLPVGARIGAVLGLVLLIGAGYLLWSPIQIYPADGFPIKCGSATSLPNDDLGTAACGDVNIIRQWQAGTLAVAGLAVALGSLYAFGVQRRREPVIGSTRPETPKSDPAPGA
jgi:hypothetical protein